VRGHNTLFRVDTTSELEQGCSRGVRRALERFCLVIRALLVLSFSAPCQHDPRASPTNAHGSQQEISRRNLPIAWRSPKSHLSLARSPRVITWNDASHLVPRVQRSALGSLEERTKGLERAFSTGALLLPSPSTWLDYYRLRFRSSTQKWRPPCSTSRRSTSKPTGPPSGDGGASPDGATRAGPSRRSRLCPSVAA
jgi:hypothetical protein